MSKTDFLEIINQHIQDTMMTYLGIEYIAYTDKSLTARMPIDKRTHNPARILHGGAMMALVESVGSALSYMFIDPTKQDVRGVEINGNHLKSARSGYVTATATIVHKGRQLHVCEVKITDDNGNLLNTSRMTNFIVDVKK